MIARFIQLYQKLHDILWVLDSKGFSPAQRRLIRALQITYLVYRDVTSGLLPLRAMSLVYTTLLSLVPLLAVSFSVLKGFGVHNQLEPALLNLLEPLGDKGVEITHNIIEFVEKINVGVLGALGLAFLLYTVVSMIQKIESSFNYTWRVSTHRSLVQRISNYLSVLTIGPVLVFAALGITATVMSSTIVQTLMSYPYIGALIEFGGRLVPYALIILAFTFIYIFIPNTKVKIAPAFIGAIVAGVMWQSAGWLFASFVVGATKYTAIYSALATLIIFMIWLYASWVITLIGTNIAYYVQNAEQCRLHPYEFSLSSRQEEKIALLIMALVGKHYYQGLKQWNEIDLAEYLSIPQQAIDQVLKSLFQARLLAETADDPPGLLPARPAEKISLAEILDVMRNEGELPDNEINVPSDRTIDQIYTQLETAIHESLKDKTLQDIANVEPNVVSALNNRHVS